MAEEPELESGAAPERQPDTPGARLRAAREAQGLSIQDVATRTRIAQRQLEAIERDDYAALPGIPYAVGFARAYARAIDVDEVAIAADVRSAVHNSDLGSNRYEAFEPADPARVPSRALAWTAAAIVVLLVAGFAVWRTQVMTPPTGEEIAAQQAAPAPAATKPAAGARPAAPVVQTVVFTANDDVWLRIYDETGERLKDGLMKKGESFTLPANARNPMILTGRPQALAVTVGGKPIAPLGPPDRTIADVPVNAEALLARAAPAAGQVQGRSAPAAPEPVAPASASVPAPAAVD
ncbi:helix-turn-helix domain-containing protein [Sphingobium indicum]|uniref:Helix-turn-helix domain-containing protein n=1 Tax=Sphingobium indicum TaxID=332055 RepID=A0A4Q4JAK3_9SPHN|nr:helix-turn-helix domain-containing protein [Sphingobium indicum]EPR17521.1 XRE family transcriptional regulator [Sphingobium indicum IP26]EPR18268.1 XRE family transcriptional regulator [Sphingobium indicum IP26]NYI21897.1 cytoskeletal protein RodZ [Sphingobium indicum]RYM03342.1 helix-turn-helix domain-containing protein [Sphingobium indicum]